MARYHHLLIIDQEWDVESKRLDALRNLTNLFVAVNPRISRIRFQTCRTEVNNLQRRYRLLHRFTSDIAERK
jgi:hypothetical protein